MKKALPKSKASEPAVRCAYTRLAKLAELKANPRNPNQHPPEQLALYWKVVQHQGIRRAIVVSKQSGFIVTGHGLYETLKANGMATAPVDEQDFKSPADEWAHLLADNRLPQLADLDAAQLATLESEISLAGLDLELTGMIIEPPAKPAAPAPIVDLNETYELLVECSSAAQRKRVIKILTGLGIECEISK